MTPAKRLLQRLVEKVGGTFYEGPEPPARLAELVVDFANRHPEATRGEWAEFARRLAGTCYRSGFQRGYERAERDPDPEWRRLPPDLVADQEDPDWRWSAPVGPDLARPDDVPADDAASREG